MFLKFPKFPKNLGIPSKIQAFLWGLPQEGNGSFRAFLGFGDSLIPRICWFLGFDLRILGFVDFQDFFIFGICSLWESLWSADFWDLWIFRICWFLESLNILFWGFFYFWEFLGSVDFSDFWVFGINWSQDLLIPGIFGFLGFVDFHDFDDFWDIDSWDLLIFGDFWIPGIFASLGFLSSWGFVASQDLPIPRIYLSLKFGNFGALLIFGICILGFPGFADFWDFFPCSFWLLHRRHSQAILQRPGEQNSWEFLGNSWEFLKFGQDLPPFRGWAGNLWQFQVESGQDPTKTRKIQSF